jgi:hypothetical protein
MSDVLVNPQVSPAGLTLIRNCHLERTPAIPGPSTSEILLDPTSSPSQFSLDCYPTLMADMPVTISYTLSGNTMGGVRAIVMGASTTLQSGDGAYTETITPLADTVSIQFRTLPHTDGKLSAFGADVA